jgi:hypothetical protein
MNPAFLTQLRRLGRRLLCAGSVAVAATVGADDTLSRLLTILRDRGNLSEQEYQNLLKSNAAASSAATNSITDRLSTDERMIQRLESDLAKQRQAFTELKGLSDGTSSSFLKGALKDKWYERISLRGYVQFRFNHVFTKNGPVLDVPADRSVRETDSLFMRRGRLVFSGDATERLSIYAQTEFTGQIGGAGEFSLQMRDFYADVALDQAKEFRVRVGLSKVPFGWVNMQSSQNRGPFERPDALNSAAEGERDAGVFVMWAPVEARQRYKDLVRLGLKGSGDYGVLTAGAYAGQGLNRSDENGEPHWLARAAYPFKLDNGQYFELGLQGYHGRYVPTLAAVGTPAFTPTAAAGGVVDRRAGVTAVWYPQPFGFEAEWMVGEGPELNLNRRSITSEFLHGGYAQLNYRAATSYGVFFPFSRWNFYDGGRKFGSNAPAAKVNELDLGLEWSPWPEVELTLVYTRSFERTNTRTFPYNNTEDANRVGMQVQVNF